jgi:hypothetical protein
MGRTTAVQDPPPAPPGMRWKIRNRQFSTERELVPDNRRATTAKRAAREPVEDTRTLPMWTDIAGGGAIPAAHAVPAPPTPPPRPRVQPCDVGRW